jgi:hypothetical protein
MNRRKEALTDQDVPGTKAELGLISLLGWVNRWSSSCPKDFRY